MENWRKFKFIINEDRESVEPEAERLWSDESDAPEKKEDPQPVDQKANKVEINKKYPIVNGRNLLQPITGVNKISAGYNQKRGKHIHGAIDQNTRIKTPCIVVADGTVVEAIDQASYDKSCNAFINIMKDEIFGVNQEKLKYADQLVLKTKIYANGRGSKFHGEKLRTRLKDPRWRALALKKLNSVSPDWNGIRDFQKFLSGPYKGSPKQICRQSLDNGWHCNFCAMLMRYLRNKGRVDKKILAGKFITILTDPDHKGKQWRISYMHMDSYNFALGDKVLAGQEIGKSGASGIADDSPHLHFVLRQGPKKGGRLDPRKYIPSLA